MVLLDVIREQFRLPLDGPTVEELTAARLEVHDALGALRVARYRASTAWRRRLPDEAMSLTGWADQAVAADARDRAAFAEVANRLGVVARDLPGMIARAKERLTEATTDRRRRARRRGTRVEAAGGAGPGAGRRPPGRAGRARGAGHAGARSRAGWPAAPTAGGEETATRPP